MSRGRAAVLTMSSRGWNGASYLDALRPDLGWHVQHALLASYSADLVALVAAMLALAGLDDDRGSGSKVDFATSVERLAGKFRLVIQSGRLLAPRKAPKVLGLLDQFIRTVPFDESKQSWHPKIVLVKTRCDDGDDVEWRLWIGSRNLTRDMSWDVGLTLVGRVDDGGGKPIDGLIELARSLADRAELDGVTADSTAAELDGVRWQCPDGCDVGEVWLHDDGQDRSLPDCPDGVSRLLVISPFLDGTTVKHLSGWGGTTTTRTLLSSKIELLKLAAQAGKPLAGFQDLLMMSSPDPDDVTSAMETTAQVNDSEDEEPEPRGLHAKVIVAEHNGGATMWVGSANATGRGWSGPNAEVIAKAEISPDVLSGIWEFVNTSASTVRPDELVDPPDEDPQQERLEQARSEVAAGWSVTQAIVDRVPVLTAAVDPNPVYVDIRLHVSALSGNWVDWPRGETQVRLPTQDLSEVTELVVCRLSLGDLQTVWLQRATMDPPPGLERDQRALARYLDPKTFFESLRSLMTGTSPGDGGGSWMDRAGMLIERAIKDRRGGHQRWRRS